MSRKPGCRLGCRLGCRWRLLTYMEVGMCIGTSLYKQFLSGIRVWRSCVVFQRGVLQFLWSLLCNLIDMSVLGRGSMGDWLAASRTRGDSKWIWTSRFLSSSRVFQVLLFCNSWNSLFSLTTTVFWAPNLCNIFLVLGSMFEDWAF